MGEPRPERTSPAQAQHDSPQAPQTPVLNQAAITGIKSQIENQNKKFRKALHKLMIEHTDEIMMLRTAPSTRALDRAAYGDLFPARSPCMTAEVAKAYTAKYLVTYPKCDLSEDEETDGQSSSSETEKGDEEAVEVSVDGEGGEKEESGKKRKRGAAVSDPEDASPARNKGKELATSETDDYQGKEPEPVTSEMDDYQGKELATSEIDDYQGKEPVTSEIDDYQGKELATSETADDHDKEVDEKDEEEEIQASHFHPPEQDDLGDLDFSADDRNSDDQESVADSGVEGDVEDNDTDPGTDGEPPLQTRGSLS
ncbi:hypothetical protein QBC34DRAFT_498284 [Podospora aff. communis PSN243]|uniref:Uncharacterized protein n=1 Tax=Podospora aff. communis PSN243 TaxID=3040156 RepID=A0AAV9GBJ8_9PEZI|nr:hypothetical protein QBC34DRAFT_498284 [Podospora aff. communis PSN243]